jgi:hypothetical protein
MLYPIELRVPSKKRFVAFLAFGSKTTHAWASDVGFASPWYKKGLCGKILRLVVILSFSEGSRES